MENIIAVNAILIFVKIVITIEITSLKNLFRKIHTLQILQLIQII